MATDQSFAGFPDLVNGVKVDEYHDPNMISPNFYQYPDFLNENIFTAPSPDVNFLESPFPQPDLGNTAFFRPTHMGPGAELDVPSPAAASSLSPPSTGMSLGGDSPSDEIEYSETVLKFMSQILMEENIEDKPCMFYDPLDLQVTEKSFYDALGKEYPPCPNKYLPPPGFKHNIESPDLHHAFYSSSSCDTSGSTSTSTDSQGLSDIGEDNSSFSKPNLQSNSGSIICLENPTSNGVSNNSGDGMKFLDPNLLTDGDQYQLQFRRGLEEGNKFLPAANPLVLDFKSSMVSPVWKGQNLKVEKGEGESSPDVSRGKKNRGREDVESEEEGRNNKQPVMAYAEENEFLEMFEETLSAICSQNEPQENIARKAAANNGGKSSGRAKKQGNKKKTVDLNTLLILCAQAVSAGENERANQLLKQVRQNSTPLGDGSQRLAHFFANGLEARLAGTGSGIQLFYNSFSKTVSAPEILRTYKLHSSICPFKRFSLAFTISMILKVAEKAKTLHVIDFGIRYGLQSVLLIKKLSQRPGGSPKLRITGIELPQPGLRPAECLEETGRRLAKYCAQYNVPFEFHGIASQNWETIRIEDLKIDKNNETVAVSCMHRFKNLLDETARVETSPRDAVLKLIRKMNPDIFVHSIVNGAYNAPFFVPRFRAALFHFSALFDIFDATLPPGNPSERLMFEREFYGREVMNVIACEELQRVERPETYKQWQVRTTRAGFKLLPLDQTLLNPFRWKMKEWYHKDFLLDEDNHWLLQGWKGRIVYANSCWVPA